MQLRTSYEHDKRKYSRNLQTITSLEAQFDQAMQELRLMEDEWKKVQEAYQHWQNENIRIQAEQKVLLINLKVKIKRTFTRFMKS